MSLFSKMFNSEKKDTTYTGPKPYGSLRSAAGGEDYYKTILGRSQGQGVGYGDSYASQMANPIIQNSRARFQDYTMPELNSELSLTGRRRGSAGFSQVAQAQKEQGLQEGDIYSQLQQRNEDLMRDEQSQAISQLGDFNKGDYDAMSNLANFEYADNSRQVGEANDRRANQAKGMQALGQAGVQMLLGQNAPNPFGGGNPTGQTMYAGNTPYPVTSPPTGYNYNYQKPQKNYAQQIMSRLGLGRV